MSLRLNQKSKNVFRNNTQGVLNNHGFCKILAIVVGCLFVGTSVPPYMLTENAKADEDFDFYEDFSVDNGIWTEYPNSKIELDYAIDQRLEFTNWKRSEPGYIYQQYSTEDFVLEYDITITNNGGNGNMVGPGFSDTLNTINQIQNGAFVTYYNGYGPQLCITTYVNGNQEWSWGSQHENYVNINLGVTYYVRFEKNGNTFTLNVFSDSEKTNHISGSPVSVTSSINEITFNYLYAISAPYIETNWEWTSGWIDNFKISTVESDIDTEINHLTIESKDNENLPLFRNEKAIIRFEVVNNGNQPISGQWEFKARFYDRYNIGEYDSFPVLISRGNCELRTFVDYKTFTLEPLESKPLRFEVDLTTKDSKLFKEKPYEQYPFSENSPSFHFADTLEVSFHPVESNENLDNNKLEEYVEINLNYIEDIFDCYSLIIDVCLLCATSGVGSTQLSLKTAASSSSVINTALNFANIANDIHNLDQISWNHLSIHISEFIVGVAINFADNPYDFIAEFIINLEENLEACNDLKQWLISEIIWILIESYDIVHDELIWILMETEDISRELLISYLSCPVDLIIKDPDGLIVSKELTEIPNSKYIEIDLNSDESFDDILFIENPKIGDYHLNVIPENSAAPDDIYTLKIILGDANLIIAENVSISDIPNQPYRIRVTESGIMPIILSKIDINPNTLNAKNKGKWITCYIELSDEYDVNYIDGNTLLLNDLIPAENHPTDIGDYDHDGIPDLMVKFDRQDVIDNLEAGDLVEISITGELTDGTLFQGTDYIRVIE